MKRYLVFIFCLLLLMACGGSKTNTDSVETSHNDVASVDTGDNVETTYGDTATADDMDAIANIPMPKAADELFDDFIFNFAANKNLQLERILFPLKSINGDRVDTIRKNQWKTERYFMRQDFYTLLFDSERHMEVVKDTAVSHAVVEAIYFNTGAIIQHVFDRLRGTWMLTSIQTIPISQSENASFLDFYHHFTTDSLFQVESLDETIYFEGPDPDDDFARMEGVITPETWEAFAPELPQKKLYNIIYGHPRKGDEGKHKIFVLRGIANGLELEMTFKRKGDSWKLIKLTT